MPKVRVLPEHIASQIAAGEVVERPSSVVKELVENAIDAGATKVAISLSEGCHSIRVADNGCGMEPEDAVLALQRHATSKLKSADELWQLHTLGFRGEALPSIASVSRLVCYTRTKDNTIGTRVASADGALQAGETGCAVGTVIEITDLFYNVPARLKFLKKAQTEFAHIHETVQSLAIAYPGISFELFNEGDLKLSTPGSGNFTDAIISVGHFANTTDILEILATDDELGFTLEARLAGAKHFRGDRKGILSIVNQRPVRCALTYKALDYAYADLIPRGRYPLAVVHLQIKPSELDINIHPTKKEIKYARGNDVYSFIQRQIVRALRDHRSGTFSFSPTDINSPAISVDNTNGYPNRRSEATTDTEQLDFKPALHYQSDFSDLVRRVSESGVTMSKDVSPGRAWRAPTDVSATFAPYGAHEEAGGTPALPESLIAKTGSQFDHGRGTPCVPASSTPALPESLIAKTGSQIDHGRGTPCVPASPTLAADSTQRSATLPNDWKLIGYLHNTYILLQTPDGLSIVEQHIAHERTLYERLLAQQDDPQKHPENYQRLVISCPLNLSPEQVACLEQNIDSLADLGFEFEPDSTNGSESSAQSLPESAGLTVSSSYVCTQVPVELAHQDYPRIIQSMLQELSDSAAPNIKLEITKSIACQSAIKNGMPLSDRAIAKLLKDWSQSPRNETCPHGRPIKLDFPLSKLFQWFHPA